MEKKNKMVCERKAKMRIISGKAKGTKLYTLEGLTTRPTLDRVKESIFNIIQNEIKEAVVLDLFSGSGAIGLEAASRGAKKVILCDKSREAVEIIKKNVEKTHLKEKVQIYNLDYIDCLEKIKNEKIDLIYLDPPYNSNFIKTAIQKMQNLNMIGNETKIIVETDDEKRVLEEIIKLGLKITDRRKYGRADIIFATNTI